MIHLIRYTRYIYVYTYLSHINTCVAHINLKKIIKNIKNSKQLGKYDIIQKELEKS
jgi:hypothetical protein